MPNGQTLLISILLFISLLFTSCVDEKKRVLKPSKVLLEGTPSEKDYKLAHKYFAEGEYKKALTAQLSQLTEDLKYYEDDSLEIAVNYNDIGLVYDALKEYDKALDYYKKTMKIDEVRLESNSTERSTTYLNIASAYDGLNNYNEAIVYYEKALAIDEKLRVKNDEALLALYEALAEVYQNASKEKLALKYLKKVLLFKERNYGTEDARTKETRAELNTIERKIQ